MTILLIFAISILLPSLSIQQQDGYNAPSPPAPTTSAPYGNAPPPPPPKAPAPYAGPAPPAPSPPPTAAAAGGYEDQGANKALGSRNRPFPLESCYLNKDGFMCCNKELEKLMDKTYSELAGSRGGHWKKCNYHQVATAVQRKAENHFGVDFETVAGAGDYASKNYFNQDLICKIKRDSQYILAFATPN